MASWLPRLGSAGRAVQPSTGTAADLSEAERRPPGRISRKARVRLLMACVVVLTLAGVSGVVTVALGAIQTLTIGNAATYYLVVGSGSSQSSVVPVSGGTAPYSLAVVSGQMPPGVTLTAGGALTGIPTAAGVYRPTVSVTDASGASVSEVVAVPVVALTAVSARPNGSLGGSSTTPTVSGEGSRIAFTTTDSELFPGLPIPQVAVRDTTSGNLLLASTTTDGTPNPGATLGSASISNNGRYVLIGTNQWSPDGQNPGYWLKDLQSGDFRLALATQVGATINPGEVADSGNVVVVPGVGPNGAATIDVVDLGTGQVTRPVLCPGDNVGLARLTPDARYLVFQEDSSGSCIPAGMHVVVFDRNTNTSTSVAMCDCPSPISSGRLARQIDISDDGQFVTYWSDRESGYSEGVFIREWASGAVAIPIPPPPRQFDAFLGGRVQMSGDANRVVTRVTARILCIYNRQSQTQSCFDTQSPDLRSDLSGDGQTLTFQGGGGSAFAIYSLRLHPDSPPEPPPSAVTVTPQSAFIGTIFTASYACAVPPGATSVTRADGQPVAGVTIGLGITPDGVNYQDPIELDVAGTYVVHVTCGNRELLSDHIVVNSPPVDCKDAAVFGGRGSRDQDSGNDYPGGRAVEIADRLKTEQTLGLYTDGAIGIEYPAALFPWEDLYNQSVDAGVADLLQRIRQVRSHCGPTFPILLVGFSQGAHVIQSTLDTLADEALQGGDTWRSIAGVALLASPRFDPTDRTARGSFVTEYPNDGIVGPAVIPDRFAGVTRTYCISNDLVCAGGVHRISIHTGGYDSETTEGHRIQSDVVGLLAYSVRHRHGGSVVPTPVGMPKFFSLSPRVALLSAAEIYANGAPTTRFDWDFNSNGTIDIPDALPAQTIDLGPTTKPRVIKTVTLVVTFADDSRISYCVRLFPPGRTSC